MAGKGLKAEVGAHCLFHPHTMDILGGIILCCEGPSKRCRIFSGLLDLSPLNAGGIPRSLPPTPICCKIQKCLIFACCPMEQNCLQFRPLELKAVTVIQDSLDHCDGYAMASCRILDVFLKTVLTDQRGASGMFQGCWPVQLSENSSVC